ncbi:MAG: Gfo/Idh/MocA family protein [Ilumatobacteraceae bacterium]
MGDGRFRSAVVGCGAISDEHLRFLDATTLTNLEAVCDLSPALAGLTADRFGARVACTDVDTLLADVAPDVVHVLTPPRTHPSLIRRCLAAGSHVICEKPLAPSADETAAVLAAADSAGRRLIETRNLLYNDVVNAMDHAIASDRFGEVREVDVSLALDLSGADIPQEGLGLPGGLAHDYLPHLAYLLLHVTGTSDVPDAALGVVRNLSGRAEIGFDHVDAMLSLGRVRARVRISPDVAPSSLRLVARGTRGSVEADVYQPYLRLEGPPWVGKLAPFGLVVQGIGLARAGGRNLRHRLLQHGTYHGMARMLDATYRALLDRRSPPVSAGDMIASALLIDRIVELTGRDPLAVAVVAPPRGAPIAGPTDAPARSAP